MKYLSAHFSGPRNLLSTVNGKIQRKMGKEIFKKPQGSIENLKDLKVRTEYSVWYLTNIGIHNENLMCYLEPP